MKKVNPMPIGNYLVFIRPCSSGLPQVPAHDAIDVNRSMPCSGLGAAGFVSFV